MLQISSGKFFDTKDCWETPHRGVFYTNCSFIEQGPIVTSVGSILQVKRSGDLRVLTCEVTERLPKMPGCPYAGEQIASNGDSLIQDFSAILSFGLKAIVTPDQHLAQRLLFADRPALGIDALPGQYISRIFDKEILFQPAEITDVQAFIVTLIGLGRKHYSAALRAIQRYVTAMHRLADDLDLAYTLLVASIESLAQEFDEFVPTWADYDSAKRKQIDAALGDAPEDIAESVKRAILDIEHAAAGKRFREFTMGHLPSSFFRTDAARQASPAGRADLIIALRSAYGIRSKYVHTLAPLPKNLKGMPGHNDLTTLEGSPTLTFQGLSRVARQVIQEFVEHAPQVGHESYAYEQDIPGRLTLQWAPSVWVHLADRFTVDNAREFLNGYLALLTDCFLRGQDQSSDLRSVLCKIEALVPTVSKPRQRMPMLALYYLFSCGCPPEIHPSSQKFLLPYYREYFSPSIESLLVHLWSDAKPIWPIEESDRLLHEYMGQRYHKNGLNAGPLFGAGMALYVAELYRDSGNEVRCRELVSEAVENFPGMKGLSEFETKIKTDPIPKIDVDVVLLPPKI